MRSPSFLCCMRIMQYIAPTRQTKFFRGFFTVFDCFNMKNVVYYKMKKYGSIQKGAPAGAVIYMAELSERQKHIRNFSIIAHIDHGKSTLADRILEFSNTVTAREMEAQLLDDMELERERGITIKARAVRINYTDQSGETYSLNLIDTPGHVDFNYEVSRSLNACEGALLVVDATQGIEAQTLANAYLAVDADLEIVPVINKIDLASAMPDKCREEIEDVIGIPAEGCPAVSAKTGLNIQDVMDAIISQIPCPSGDETAPLRCLIFDSAYNAYLGVVVYIRVIDGTVRPGDKIRLMSTGAQFEVTEVGALEAFGMRKLDCLQAGDVGYITASIKTVSDTQVGDTITHADRPCSAALPGFKSVQPMVYAGIYPADGAKYNETKDALEKLRLNDAADGTVLQIDNPSNFPSADEIEAAAEPMVAASIITPTEYVGGIMDLCQDRRGVYLDMKYLDTQRVELHYTLPLNEIIYDFFDALKSRSKGYASLDYEVKGYEPSELVKLDILLNGDVVDALTFIVHKDKAYARARKIAEKLKDNIPRQLFEVPIQAAIGSKIIARETVKAMRKDVLAKCYGGDITRKKKLLEKQKEGKKKMRQLGSVQVSPEAFMAVLKLDDE